MKMGKKCDCDCSRCYPLCVAYPGDFCVYRYCGEKNRNIGIAILMQKYGHLTYTYVCLIRDRRCK